MTSNLGGFEIKEEYSAKWLHIFYHNSNGALYFNSFDEATFSLNPKKYSIFKLMHKIRTYEKNKYEFLLEYPECKPLYNRWKQSSKVNAKTTQNYEPLQISFSTGFHGIRKSLSNNTAYYGHDKENNDWHFAIGAFTYYSQKETFPGPLNNCSINYVKEGSIWIRIASFENIFKFNICTRNFRTAQYNTIFLYFVIS